MVKTMYIDEHRIGRVLDFTYTNEKREEQPVVAIPAGSDEVVTTFDVKDPEELDRFMQALREAQVLAMNKELSDAQVAKEYLEEGGALYAEAMDALNVLSVMYVRKGKDTFLPVLMVFEDGSHLGWQ